MTKMIAQPQNQSSEPHPPPLIHSSVKPTAVTAKAVWSSAEVGQGRSS